MNLQGDETVKEKSDSDELFIYEENYPECEEEDDPLLKQSDSEAEFISKNDILEENDDSSKLEISEVLISKFTLDRNILPIKPDPAEFDINILKRRRRRKKHKKTCDKKISRNLPKLNPIFRASSSMVSKRSNFRIPYSPINPIRFSITSFKSFFTCTGIQNKKMN